MIRMVLLLAAKVVGGLLVAGLIIGILVPLLPGLLEPWMLMVVAAVCVTIILVATWDHGLPSPPS